MISKVIRHCSMTFANCRLSSSMNKISHTTVRIIDFDGSLNLNLVLKEKEDYSNKIGNLH